jgi:hypothetical protein
VDGSRGLFIFAANDIDEAKAYVATDPVIIKGEMVAEYHKYYGSAALMLVRDAHEQGGEEAVLRRTRAGAHPLAQTPRLLSPARSQQALRRWLSVRTTAWLGSFTSRCMSA